MSCQSKLTGNGVAACTSAIKSSNDAKDQQVTAVATETEIESGNANTSQRKLSWKEWTAWEFVSHDR
jgi:hypothetical protein